MTRRFRSSYGAGPLHLLVLIACFALAGAGVIGWAHVDLPGIVAWLIAVMLLYELVLFPLSSALDRAVFSRARSEAAAGPGDQAAAPPRRRGWFIGLRAVPYVRVPAMLSGLLLITFFPLILRAPHSSFHSYTGLSDHVYFARWLAATGVLYGLSGLAYAFSVWRARGTIERLHSKPGKR